MRNSLKLAMIDIPNKSIAFYAFCKLSILVETFNLKDLKSFFLIPNN